jgi:hypothetical protein
MIYCLILLVELAPKQRLALGIAALSAGEDRFQAMMSHSHLAYSEMSMRM